MTTLTISENFMKNVSKKLTNEPYKTLTSLAEGVAVRDVGKAVYMQNSTKMVSNVVESRGICLCLGGSPMLGRRH